MVIKWPYHKFRAVQRAYRREGIRQRKALQKLRDPDALDWSSDTVKGPAV